MDYSLYARFAANIIRDAILEEHRRKYCRLSQTKRITSCSVIYVSMTALRARLDRKKRKRLTRPRTLRRLRIEFLEVRSKKVTSKRLHRLVAAEAVERIISVCLGYQEEMTIPMRARAS